MKPFNPPEIKSQCQPYQRSGRAVNTDIDRTRHQESLIYGLLRRLAYALHEQELEAPYVVSYNVFSRLPRGRCTRSTVAKQIASAAEGLPSALAAFAISASLFDANS